MKNLSISVGRVVMLGGVLTLGVILGSFTINTTNAKTDQKPTPVTIYPKNESGETYGSGLYARTVEDQPVLIEAFGEGGVKGYVRKKDLIGDIPKTPEEAIALTKKRQTEGPGQVPLYDVDGKTVIGVFKFSEVKTSEQE
jgi:hypothetical protein